MAHPENDPEFQDYVTVFREGLRNLGCGPSLSRKVVRPVDALQLAARSLECLFATAYEFLQPMNQCADILWAEAPFTASLP